MLGCNIGNLEFATAASAGELKQFRSMQEAIEDGSRARDIAYQFAPILQRRIARPPG